MKPHHAVSGLFCLSLLVSACAANGTRRGNAGSPKVQQAQAQTEAAALSSLLKSVKRSKSNYKISPTDLLEITVYREKDLNRTLRVNHNDYIAIPLAGNIKVGGLHVIEAGELISEKLSEFLINPQVTVFITEYGNKQIYVLGEVKSPGSFEVPTESQLTVLEAISKAGGFSPVAAKDRTKVIRTNPDGKNVIFTIEVSAIMKKGRKDKDIPLEPNDVVYVPQSYF